MPMAASPETTSSGQSASTDSERSRRSQSLNQRSASRESRRSETLESSAPPPPSSSQPPTRSTEETNSSDLADLLGSFHPRKIAGRGVGSSESTPASTESTLKRLARLAPTRGGGIGSSGRGGIGGSYSDEFASAKAVPAAHRPPAASREEPVQPMIRESSRSGGGGQRGAFGDLLAAQDARKANSLLVPVLIVLALALLAVIGVLYFLFR